MYCLSCGTNLPDEALFCLKCGKLIPRESGDTPTSTAAFLPSYPLSSEASTPNPYAPLTPPPPPPPQYRRPSPGLLKGLLSGLLLLLLLSGGIGILLLLEQGVLSLSALPTVRSTATQPATVLYQADWSAGLDGWVGSQDWKMQNGMLVSDGTNQPTRAAGPTILAPYQVTASGNFAIETRVQPAQTASSFDFDPLLFHGSSTAHGWQGYKLTVCSCKDVRLTSDDFNDVLGRAAFDPGTAWHTYRVEVRGSTMTVIFDGTTLFTVHDSRYLSGRQVGIKSSTQLTVSSFKITSL